MENLFFQPDILNGTLHLTPEESKHCVKVLRKKAGDLIRITDGAGHFYNALIIKADPGQCEFSIQTSETETLKNYSIHLAISPTKNIDRIEWMVEKCVEIGVDQITLLNCQHTEKKFVKTDRLNKIAIVAIKQSGRAWLPQINPITPIRNFIEELNDASKFIAFVDQSNPDHLMNIAKPAENYIILIGPEGDFSTEELVIAQQHGFEKISLGPYRLRTETAGLAACHMLNLINR